MILSHEIAWGENAIPAHTISKSELAWLQKNWDTDGYWYFYAKGNPKETSVLAHVKQDRSDVMLESLRSSIWTNARRTPTPDELRKAGVFGYYQKFTADPPQILCDQVTVGVESYSNAHSRDLLGAKIVIRDFQRNKLKSFSVFREYNPPTVLKGYVRDDHDDGNKPLSVPIESSAYAVLASKDCTFFAKLEDGIVRFNIDGTTKAMFPPSMRLVYDEQILQLDSEFESKFSFGPRREHFSHSLQPRLWFFYHKLFEGEKK